jgi:hypothetical protein
MLTIMQSNHSTKTHPSYYTVTVVLLLLPASAIASPF